ncbi:MAG: oligopeptide transporter, OPT family [Candidatus Kapabacteria bacterium]|nr:oligopeptide transporter, OPT family [Candidatus Kapabacteria bacterium]
MEEKKYVPFVPPDMPMAEMTVRALIIGLIMSVVLGAANAYLGLKAGMTIAATYPAAVIGMAFLKIFKGSILEENIARTVGSIGESVAAGAIFTIPAFIIAGVWDGQNFWSVSNYLQTSAVLLVGGLFGILFITIIRRVMVEDRELPFPESVAAAEIHKAGRTGSSGAKFLFSAMGVGALIQVLKQIKLFASSWSHYFPFALGNIKIGGTTITTGGGSIISTPGVSPAYMGVGYIIGPNLAALNFTGGLLAWGLFVPVLMFFIAPSINIDNINKDKYFNSIFIEKIVENQKAKNPSLSESQLYDLAQKEKNKILVHLESNKATEEEKMIYSSAQVEAENRFLKAKSEYEKGTNSDLANKYYEINNESWVSVGESTWKNVVRKIAIGGMLMSAAFTLWRMRKSLIQGIGRAVRDTKKAAGGTVAEDRTQQDMNFKWVFILILLASVATFFIYYWFSGTVIPALIATVVMVIAGFFFAAVSGYLVGLIGSSNNPISGLTISTLLIAAVLMVILGTRGEAGVPAVLGVAAVVCVAAAVAGEMLQDLKVGHIIGGTPWKMQFGDILGIILAAAVMFFPLLVLHQGDIQENGNGTYTPGVTGLGGKEYPAPQASLMAILSQGILGGSMEWGLIIVGILMAIGFILVKVKSPMLVCVGMYLPLETSFAIFIGGLIKGILDKVAEKKKFNEAQQARVGNTGVLLAAGLIAGEALIGLLFALFAVLEWKIPTIFDNPTFFVSLLVFLIVGWILVRIPVKNAGSPDEPAPPAAMV